jgi:UDP-galactopyranose mutase
MYDFLVIGAGLFGSVFSRQVAEHGKTVLLIDKRPHIGGMCYTEKIEGIDVHKYGPHTFHTEKEEIWKFVNKFAKFNSFQQRTKVNYKNNIYSFPINMMTLQQLWGVTTPEQARKKLQEVRINIENPHNLEEWILSQVGEEIYNIFIKGYTEKQWGRDASSLPSFIIKRLPIRLTYDDRYFSDDFQGVPINGYTNMFENMLDHKNIKIDLNINFFENQDLKKAAKKTVYTGKVDEFFNYKHGELQYRSLRFETEVLNGDFQGNSIFNYTDKDVPFTRIVEHKHFVFKESDKTVITKEYPDSYDHSKIPFYPVFDDENRKIYEKYAAEQTPDVIFGGRLGTYKYYDMHQIVAQALTKANQTII